MGRMGKLPLVAIIGRPNVGKSTLFNALTGTRRAIVSPIPGTTRDPVMMRVEADEVAYLLLDTGGLGGGSSDHALEEDVALQSRLALQSADVILFTLSARDELTASDHVIIDLLRKERRRHVPIIIVATKCDKRGVEEQAMPEFQALGIAEDVLAVSAVHRGGIGELEDAIVHHLKKLHFKKEAHSSQLTAERSPRVAVVGRPNVGKSSIVNALMPEPMRETIGHIVSPIPGTTRDASDTVIAAHGTSYVFVDTAGLRRKAGQSRLPGHSSRQAQEDLESLCVIQSMKAIGESDVVILVLDATQPISHQDKRIAGMAIEEGKGLIVLLNKEDLLDAEGKKTRAADVAASLSFCRFAPVLFASGLTREGLRKLFPLIDAVVRNRLRRIAAKDLREWYLGTVRGVPARTLTQSKHITQAAAPPPTFVLFVKNPQAVQVSQLRYLENKIRQTFAFEGTPIRWITKRA